MKNIILHKDTVFRLFEFQRKLIDNCNLFLNKNYLTSNKNYFFPATNFYIQLQEQVDFTHFSKLIITGPKIKNLDLYFECKLLPKDSNDKEILTDLLIAKCVLSTEEKLNFKICSEYSTLITFEEETKIFQICKLNKENNCNYISEEKWVKLH